MRIKTETPEILLPLYCEGSERRPHKKITSLALFYKIGWLEWTAYQIDKQSGQRTPIETYSKPMLLAKNETGETREMFSLTVLASPIFGYLYRRLTDQELTAQIVAALGGEAAQQFNPDQYTRQELEKLAIDLTSELEQDGFHTVSDRLISCPIDRCTVQFTAAKSREYFISSVLTLKLEPAVRHHQITGEALALTESIPLKALGYSREALTAELEKIELAVPWG